MTANPLVGTWRLVSFEVQDDDGRITHPFGRDPVGFITYTEDGHMAVQFGRADRAHLAAGDWWAATPTEIAGAARGYFAYCGTYEFAGDTVVHRIDLSLMPNWIGGEQVRLVTLNGESVTLSTPPTPIGGRQQRGIVVWQRVMSAAPI